MKKSKLFIIGFVAVAMIMVANLKYAFSDYGFYNRIQAQDYCKSQRQALEYAQADLEACRKMVRENPNYNPNPGLGGGPCAVYESRYLEADAFYKKCMANWYPPNGTSGGTSPGGTGTGGTAGGYVQQFTELCEINGKAGLRTFCLSGGAYYSCTASGCTAIP